jgi:hemerythrin-like domain-containing protein
VLTEAAGIVRRFVEAYHEEVEERFVFPVFLRAGVMVDLVNVLWDQHRAGKRVTEAILRRTKTGEGVDELPALTRAFTAMYRPHAAREDTVLFPALRGLVGARAYAELGERFEEMERARLGARGFEGAVEEVARLEERIGIHELAQFTPR